MDNVFERQQGIFHFYNRAFDAAFSASHAENNTQFIGSIACLKTAESVEKLIDCGSLKAWIKGRCGAVVASHICQHWLIYVANPLASGEIIALLGALIKRILDCHDLMAGIGRESEKIIALDCGRQRIVDAYEALLANFCTTYNITNISDDTKCNCPTCRYKGSREVDIDLRHSNN